MSPTTSRRLLGALALGVAGALSLAACAGGPPPKPATTDGNGYELTTWTPKPTAEVDTISWNVFQGEPWTLNPFTSADYAPNMINSNMCETLLRQTPEFEIEPNLAESFENPDPLTWVYTLRDDVTFWDGSPMTAEDVAATMNHSLTDPTSFQHYLFSTVESITVTGPLEVTVKMKTPNYLFHDQLASYAGVVMQKKFIEAHPDDIGTPTGGLMCTGPFQFEEWKQGDSITLTRYDGYWNKELMPKTKQLKFTFLTDNTAITSALLSGEIDGTYAPPAASIGQLRKSDEGTLSFGPAPLVVSLFYPNPEGAMSDPAIRKALQAAIDWKGIAEQAFGGVGGPAALQTADASFGFAKEELDALAEEYATTGEPDIETAKKELEAATPEALAKTITMVVPEQAETQQLGVAVQDAAEKLGLDFDLTVVPAATYTNYLYDPATRGATDILYTTFWPNIPDPLDWMMITAVTGGSFNPYGYSGIDEGFAKAIATEDEDERAKITADLERKLREDLLPMTPGIRQDNTVWHNDRITGAPAAFDYTFYPWAAHLGGTGD
ncbi:ABC transporter substrate-binding protein [Microbacterium sp.]|uniref:ABC transporter substrate-binding protein n=1 Tax=Microbacterium sp. TaxID=51671 RepID=UPI002810E73A|nr:ABC transporter substrate-binding protein [Microbacterium sp.]